MSQSSILGGERAPRRKSGADVDALGPSDSSDSGSDVQGEQQMATTGAFAPDEYEDRSATVRHGTDTDAEGTGERASATGDSPLDGADILPDRIGRDPSVQQSDDALTAGELAEIDVEDLMADEEAGLEDEEGEGEGEGDIR